MTTELTVVPAAAELAVAGERDDVVSEATRQAIADGVPLNTTRVYDWRWAAFAVWCERELRTALPATSATLAEYVRALTECGGIAPDSVDQAIAAIRVRHRDAGFDGQPGTKPALTILRGYRRQVVHRKRQAPPIDPHELRALSAHTPAATTTGKRDRLLLVLGWSLAARRSELCALDIADVVEWDDGRGITTLVRRSKTDKDSRGREVHVWAGSYPDTDAVALLRTWRRELDAFGVTSGRLFRSVNRWGQLGNSLSPGVVTDVLRAAARRAMLPRPERYTAHSLRSGFVTTALRQHKPMAAVADQGGWSQNSAVLMGYMRARDAKEDNPTRGIGL